MSAYPDNFLTTGVEFVIMVMLNRNLQVLDPKFVLLGGIFELLGAITYLIDTLKGKARPNRVSWFLWALVPLIAFVAERGKGVGWQSLMTFSVGLTPLLIFLGSFIGKNAVWELRRLDYICGGLSLCGVVLWLLSGEGNFAIALSILADTLAGIPTLVKALKAPETESYWVFLLSAINAIVTLLTIEIWNFAHYGYPVYILLFCVVLFVVIRFRMGQRLGLWANSGLLW